MNVTARDKLPGDPTELAKLAHLLRSPSGPALLADFEKYTRHTRRRFDRLFEAVEAGDTDAAKKIAQRMYNEFLSMHDGYRNWITALLSEIGRRLGDEALEEIMVETVRAWWIPSLEALSKAGGNRTAMVKMFAAGLRGHLQPMDVEEDDEKVVLKMKPCGSGGRLVLEGK